MFVGCRYPNCEEKTSCIICNNVDILNNYSDFLSKG